MKKLKSHGPRYWREKLAGGRAPEVKVASKRFAGIQVGRQSPRSASPGMTLLRWLFGQPHLAAIPGQEPFGVGIASCKGVIMRGEVTCDWRT
jgi:hypothetical protein